MITSWKLFNFKSVKNETTLDFGPLTIFAGPNSSGKSTWIQSILLISQTLSHRVRSRSVVLNGSLTKLGQFDDLKSFGGDADQIVIGWECVPQTGSPAVNLDISQLYGRPATYYGRDPDLLKKISCELAFDVNPGSPQQELFQLQPQLFSCRIATTARGDQNVDSNSFIEVRRATISGADAAEKMRALTIEDPQNEFLRRSLEFDVSVDDELRHDIVEEYASAQIVGCIARHFLPETLTLRINQSDEDARAIVNTICEVGPVLGRRRAITNREIVIPKEALTLLRDLIGLELLEKILPSVADHLSEDRKPTDAITLLTWNNAMFRLAPALRNEARKRIQGTADFSDKLRAALDEHKSNQFSVVAYRPPTPIRDGILYSESFFVNSVKYLGPLRDEPKALYPLATGADPSDVGLRGEYTAAVLDLHKNQRIRYIPTTVFNPAEVKPTTSLRTLEAAVTDWLQYLNVAQSVLTIDQGKRGHEMKVVPPGLSQPHDLTHVGVGVSQVLPILVMCLLAEPDTTLIFEQPELHLHPRIQTLLGDFFLSLSLLGKQCVLETHSEYLINRLRFRAAAAESGDIASRIKMYFVEKQGDSSNFRPVVVNEFGAIADWPEGFFDQSQNEAEEILKAATRKRQTRGGRLPRAERND
jgi:predicted ATPase